ncbi:MAG: hypothetical protein AOA65_2305 [Candidatus Bathyarchaeota archaeon BA1]|nr:MAG: hypothetical protein AOA65_2305 [Candidatus Bathyarchaeota archaeon BA1]
MIGGWVEAYNHRLMTYERRRLREGCRRTGLSADDDFLTPKKIIKDTGKNGGCGSKLRNG